MMGVIPHSVAMKLTLKELGKILKAASESNIEGRYPPDKDYIDLFSEIYYKKK